ncbi:MAG: hypothetical protein JSR49_09770 [Proteobacteria bacterium]|nr:hypothetical protein [Pseudomonadota bacterium]
MTPQPDNFSEDLDELFNAGNLEHAQKPIGQRRKEFLEQEQVFLQKHRLVGALLREMHYLDHSEPPKQAALYPSEEAYWTASASMSPGCEVSKVRAELERRKRASSTAARAAHQAVQDGESAGDQG